MISKNGSQRTVVLKVADLDAAMSDFKTAWQTGKASQPTISFASWELMHKALTPKRLELVKALCGQEPLSIRELARRVERDFKGVHTDVTALVNAGIIDREQNKISFPYDTIHVEFDIGVAA